MITRKDFKAIAGIIKIYANINENSDFNRGCTFSAVHIAIRLADYLATTNPRFNREQFLKACGYDLDFNSLAKTVS